MRGLNSFKKRFLKRNFARDANKIMGYSKWYERDMPEGDDGDRRL